MFEPVSTLVVGESPSQGLVSLDVTKSWLGLSGTTENDQAISDLILEVSDGICGPNSYTGKCFRSWKFNDYFEDSIGLLKILELRYSPILEIEKVSEGQDEVEYSFDNRGLKSGIVTLEECHKNIRVVYDCGHTNIPRQIVLATKIAIFSLWNNRDAWEPKYERLLEPYIM